MKLHIRECEIHTIFELSPNRLIALEQIRILGRMSVVAKLAHRSFTSKLMTDMISLIL